ncbi:acyltransferase family protein [Cellulosilyticum sp. I15G10I2]|uniref:acyltransferase family protein n=1 Tax=Cellulosilyticum sp. I15G10I2 TaxID=1892843 RepID=UPI00085C9F38|nr:acyltransferase family protein [Cellulosilyticum sp. I15G10I2]
METKRAYYLDHLKIFLTVLVIVHHVGQAYGPTGGFWQYKSSLNESAQWLGSFFAVNASFFMGLFFMLSGYFIPASYDRKGFKLFINDKIYRLGIPTLFAAFVIIPCQMYFYYSLYSGNAAMHFFQYYLQIYLGIGGQPVGFISSIGWPELNFGHAWFIEQLLVYSIVYAVIRKILPIKAYWTAKKAFNMLHILILALCIALGTLFVRMFYPIDTWIGILGFIQAEPAHLPQYVILFLVGIYAFRNDLFIQCNKKTGYLALTLGLSMAAVIYCMPLLPHSITAALYAGWAWYESFMAVFISWGLIVFFREKTNKSSILLKKLSESSFIAYILHYPIVLTIQYSLDKINLGSATAKFLTVSIISVLITYSISFLIKIQMKNLLSIKNTTSIKDPV